MYHCILASDSIISLFSDRAVFPLDSHIVGLHASVMLWNPWTATYSALCHNSGCFYRVKTMSH